MLTRSRPTWSSGRRWATVGDGTKKQRVRKKATSLGDNTPRPNTCSARPLSLGLLGLGFFVLLVVPGSRGVGKRARGAGPGVGARDGRTATCFCFFVRLGCPSLSSLVATGPVARYEQRRAHTLPWRRATRATCKGHMQGPTRLPAPGARACCCRCVAHNPKRRDCSFAQSGRALRVPGGGDEKREFANVVTWLSFFGFGFHRLFHCPFPLSFHAFPSALVSCFPSPPSLSQPNPCPYRIRYACVLVSSRLTAVGSLVFSLPGPLPFSSHP